MDWGKVPEKQSEVFYKKDRDMTLHMGATKTAPSQYCGFSLCMSRATAAPIDSPQRNLSFFLFSSVSENETKKRYIHRRHQCQIDILWGEASEPSIRAGKISLQQARSTIKLIACKWFD